MAVGVVDKPIFLHELSGVSWQLLWWLICKMDDACEVHGGWRVRAAIELGRDRLAIQINAKKLLAAGLIDTAPKRRHVRVLINRISG